MDIFEEVRGARYQKIVDLLDSMPRTASWRVATEGDPTYVEQMVNGILSGDIDIHREVTPAPQEWGVINEQLATVIDLIMAYMVGKKEGFKPQARPETLAKKLVSKAVSEKKKTEAAGMLSIFAPHLTENVNGAG